MAYIILRRSKGSPLTFNELDDNFANINTEIETLTGIVGQTNWTPGAISAGANVSTTMSVIGALVTDTVIAFPAGNTNGAILHAYVSASDTVTLVYQNISGSSITPTAGDHQVRVLKAPIVV